MALPAITKNVDMLKLQRKTRWLYCVE